MRSLVQIQVGPQNDYQAKHRKPASTLGRTLTRWRTEILNHHITGAFNGPTEALNLVIKKVKRAGHGFRRFDHYRLRCLLHAGRVNWPNRPSPPRIRTRHPYSDEKSRHTAGMGIGDAAIRTYSVLYSLIPRPPRRLSEPERERCRRFWVEETERNSDREERYASAKAAGTLTHDDKEQFAQQRRDYRELGERLGKRGGVGVEGIWWVHWLRIAIGAEAEASAAFAALARPEHNTTNLLAEFDPSLSAVTASAFAIEALHNDIRFRIPPPERKRRPTQVQLIGYAFETGWDAFNRGTATPRLKDLFDRRSQAVHAYSEMRPAAPHPAGLSSGWEQEVFNAVEATRAVDLALQLVELTDGPLSTHLEMPHERWLQRWVIRRKPYRETLLGMSRSRCPSTD